MIYLDEAIKYRRSVRSFLPRPLRPEIVYRILNAGRLAPSAKNRQPWRFVVVTKTETRAAVADSMVAAAQRDGLAGAGYSVIETARIIKDAPVIVFIYMPKEKSWPVCDYISVGACAENICLKAVDEGIGSLIIADTWCAENDISRILGQSDELAVAIALGYARDNGRQAKKRRLPDIAEGIDEACVPVPVDNLPEPDIGDKDYIFISYSHLDGEEVIRDIIQLKKHGVALWYDRGISVGKKWTDEALGYLQDGRCKGILFYVSENSVKSEACARELKCAVKERNFGQEHILTVHIGDKPLAEYCHNGNAATKDICDCISDEKVFFPRGYGACGNVLPIIDALKKLGLVYNNGLYDNFEFAKVDEGIKLVKYVGTSERVEVPAAISGQPVVIIGENCFTGADSVKEILLPYCIKRIELGAFLGAHALEKINLPDGIEEICTAAFRDCISLQRVVLPPRITYMSEALFRDCTALRECIVPTGVTELKEAVFRGCSALRKVKLPSTVRKMTEGGFYGCSALSQLVLPRDIEGLEKQSFETCPSVDIVACGFHFHDGVADKL